MCCLSLTHDSRNNSASQADYNKIPKNAGGMPHMVVPPPNVNGNMNGSAGANVAGGGPFKPVPPPKPKNYRPPLQNSGNGNGQNQWENQVSCMVCCCV